MTSESPVSHGSFNILGSSKLNTPDGKNPTPSTVQTQIAEAKKEQLEKPDNYEYRKQCSKAHNDLEARLRDEELRFRSHGWS